MTRPSTQPSTEGGAPGLLALLRPSRRPARDQRHALARAIAEVIRLGQPPRRWAYLEANRTGDWWTCVLDDRTCIRVVKVHATTGTAALVLTTPLPVRRHDSPQRRRPA